MIDELIALAGRQPNRSIDEEGHDCLEWWSGPRKLTLYLPGENAIFDFIQIWGPNIFDEMYAGAGDLEDFPALWAWLETG